jgi:hypothetical protein
VKYSERLVLQDDKRKEKNAASNPLSKEPANCDNRDLGHFDPFHGPVHGSKILIGIPPTEQEKPETKECALRAFLFRQLFTAGISSF